MSAAGFESACSREGTLPEDPRMKEKERRTQGTPVFNSSNGAKLNREIIVKHHRGIIPLSVREKKQRLLKNRLFLVMMILFLLAPLGLVIYLLGRNFTGRDYIRVSPPPGWQEASPEARVDAEANLRIRLRGVDLNYLFYRADTPDYIVVFSCDHKNSDFSDLPDTVNIGEMETYLEGHRKELLKAFFYLFTDAPQNLSAVEEIRVVALRNGNVGLDLCALDNGPNSSTNMEALVFRRGNHIYNVLIIKRGTEETGEEMEYFLRKIYFG